MIRTMIMDFIQKDPGYNGGDYETQPAGLKQAMGMLFNASSTYDPSPDLEKIKARVLAINSADDFVNPPELQIVEPLVRRVKNARFVLLPITDQTRGHGTHSQPVVWKNYLAEFLRSLPQ